ncbi:Endochitinase [Dictyocoela muelleri]|nr:Endochitinase [Dictyocoela muelleri]
MADKYKDNDLGDYKNILNVIRSLGFKPKRQYLLYFYGHIQDIPLPERAILLAHVIHETAGFTTLIEDVRDIPYDDIGTGLNYYGRGFLQLTWASNYKDVSRALGLGDKLLKNPDLVASSLEIACKTALWFWRTKVKKFDTFSYTTSVINRAELYEPGLIRAKQRYYYYMKLAEAFSLNEVIDEGDYNDGKRKCCSIC